MKKEIFLEFLLVTILSVTQDISSSLYKNQYIIAVEGVKASKSFFLVPESDYVNKWESIDSTYTSLFIPTFKRKITYYHLAPTRSYRPSAGRTSRVRSWWNIIALLSGRSVMVLLSRWMGACCYSVIDLMIDLLMVLPMSEILRDGRQKTNKTSNFWMYEKNE